MTMTIIVWVFTSGMVGASRNDPADVTPAQAVTVSAVSGDAVVAHEVSVISAQRHCLPVVSWLRQHPKQYPVSMILKQDGTYRVTVTAWTYPAPRNQWTLALCSR
jgi:hypothetical protein